LAQVKLNWGQDGENEERSEAGGPKDRPKQVEGHDGLYRANPEEGDHNADVIKFVQVV